MRSETAQSSQAGGIGVEITQAVPLTSTIGAMFDTIMPSAESSAGTAGLPPSIGLMPNVLNHDSDPINGDKTDADKEIEIKKPDGVPDDWIEKPSKNGRGKEWINPNDENDRVRVMPANPNSTILLSKCLMW